MNRIEEEIQKRSSDPNWSKQIASQVGKKYKRKQFQTRINLGLAMGILTAFLVMGEFMDYSEWTSLDEGIVYFWDSLDDDDVASIIY